MSLTEPCDSCWTIFKTITDYVTSNGFNWSTTMHFHQTNQQYLLVIRISHWFTYIVTNNNNAYSGISFRKRFCSIRTSTLLELYLSDPGRMLPKGETKISLNLNEKDKGSHEELIILKPVIGYFKVKHSTNFKSILLNFTKKPNFRPTFWLQDVEVNFIYFP